MGCGSGRAIADIVAGRRPDLDFRFTDEISGEAAPVLISLPARG
jgi:D-amino-acid dehydrogenase